MQEDTPKPEMSRHEASWHEHLAGMRAAETARKQGGDPQAAEAMAWATASPVRIAGYELRPASQGTLWTLRRLAREFSAWADAIGMPKAAPGEADGSRECIEMGLTMLAFTDSLRVWDLLETERLGELITEAEKLIHRVPLEDYRKLERHFQMQMERIHGLTPEAVPEKKTPETRTGGSPAMPMPPTAEPSPTSNG